MDTMNAAIFLIVWLLIMLVSAALGLAQYIMTSLSLYTIADRRCINNPWLAWLPIGNVWIIGSIADYHDRRNGINNKWRIALLALYLVFIGLFLVCYISLIVAVISFGIMSEAEIVGEEIVGEVIGAILPPYLGLIVSVFAAAAMQACQTVCTYKVFETTVPEKALRYFLISVLVPLGSPICLMKCRNSLNGVPVPPPTFVPQPQQAETQAGRDENSPQL